MEQSTTHPFAALMESAEIAHQSDFFLAAPLWAREAIFEAVNDRFESTVRWTDPKRAHLVSALNCIKAINRRCDFEVDRYATGASATRVHRHKRSRAQIRASKSIKVQEAPKRKKGK